MISVAALVGAIPTVSVTIERYTPPTSIDAYGNPVTASPALLVRDMVVHQATRKQLERADLDHAMDVRAFYSTEDLRTVETAQPDVIQYDGERWEVRNRADYSFLGGIYMALGVRIE